SPSSGPEPTATTAPADWSADGIITEGEYAGSESRGAYAVFWRSDGQYIYVGMRAQTDGFVAVAIQPGSRMKNADIVFGFVKDGRPEVYDLFSTGAFGPHPQDTELGGTNDILEFGGSEGDGVTTIEFKRKLSTGDERDNGLSPGVNQILWSYGSDDSLTQRHTNRGYGEITLGH
ncbi:MAG: hypothetical protein FJZ95_09830, partial [Chloroflexi bacterium]|nr:hypothetical protein [Chloroflexota bacterium]